jgi:Protein of unknown function (DUF3307)
MIGTLRNFALILLAFELKHLLADYFLQSEWTLIGKERSTAWLAPLLAHSAGHAALTTCIALVVNPNFWWLGPLDLLLHAGIDRSKAVASLALAAGEGSRVWWRLFGVDQMLHNVTHLGYAVILAFSLGAS